MGDRKRYFVLAVLLALALGLGSCDGCGKKQEEPTREQSVAVATQESVVTQESAETPKPTEEPTPEPTAEPTPEPVIDFVDLEDVTLEELQAALDNEQYVTVNLNGEVLFGEGEEGMEKLKEALAAGQTEKEIKVEVKGRYGKEKVEATLTIPEGKTLNVNGRISVGAKGEITFWGTLINNGGMFLGTALKEEEGGAFSNEGLVVKPEHKHVVVKDAAVAATCTTDGLSKGSHCSVCGEILEAQQVIPATGHKEVKDAAVAANCQSEGKTEGSHCANCGEVFVKQEAIPKTGHTPVTVADQAADCTHEGYSNVTKCSTCGIILSGDVQPALGHMIQYIDKIEPECGKCGYTAWQLCNRCHAHLVEREEIPALEHDYQLDPDAKNYPPTCTTLGYVHYRCTICGDNHHPDNGVRYPLGHDFVNGVCTRCNAKESEDE
ncbi:MAG: hypothetical protein IKS85_09660 [Lachnospiraceae bacterium]|nr:hypothetical protein [Lachnospiraceae bacterium]